MFIYQEKERLFVIFYFYDIMKSIKKGVRSYVRN